MNDIPTALRSLACQEQFLDVVDRDTAINRFTGISIYTRFVSRLCRCRKPWVASWRVRLSPMSTFPGSTDQASTGSRFALPIQWVRLSGHRKPWH